MKKLLSLILALTLALSVLCVGASAKTNPNGQKVQNIFFYVVDDAGQEMLASIVPVSEMYDDLLAGRIDDTIYNYSVLDRYVTPVHQETQGFTVPEFVAYAQSKSDNAEIRSAPLTFAGKDQIAFWEMDDSNYDDLDVYTYDDLYAVTRYNFPALYEYWDFRTQRVTDADAVWDSREEATMRLSVTAYSGRYMGTGIYLDGNYNMENYWSNQSLLDTERTLRIMLPMTEADLRNQNSTASDTRYWVCYVRLDDTAATGLKAEGAVAVPTYTVVDGDESEADAYESGYYYYYFDCATSGAQIYYNQNFLSVPYMPTAEYDGGAVKVMKAASGVNYRAVKVGCTDAGVQMAKPDAAHLISSADAPKTAASFPDIPDGAWYTAYVNYVLRDGLFDSTGANSFSPDAPMTRAMLATALYRFAGSPAVTEKAPFTDVSSSAAYADAVAWCYSAGVVNGTSDTTFAPENSITREQIVTMFHRYAEKVAKADMSAKSDLAAFTDAGKLSGYAIDSMKWAVGAGLISGMTDSTIVPQGTATRAQTAALVMRLADYVG